MPDSHVFDTKTGDEKVATPEADAWPRNGRDVALGAPFLDEQIPIRDVLPAGEYGFLTYTADNQVYPGNILDIRTVSGADGAYTVNVRESAVAVPTVASVTLRSTSVKYGSTVTGTITMSGPAPEGGMFLFSESSSRLTANPSSAYVAAGATTVGFTVTTTSQRPSRDTQVTISYNTTTGTAKSVVLTVKR